MRSSTQSTEKRALEQHAKTAEERLAKLERQLASSSVKAAVPTTDATMAPARRLGPEAIAAEAEVQATALQPSAARFRAAALESKASTYRKKADNISRSARESI